MMNKIEKAIADIKAGYNTAFTVQMSLQALQAQAERDKMRCENCKYRCVSYDGECFLCDSHNGLCEPVESDDFCSYFEPKENGNG